MTAYSAFFSSGLLASSHHPHQSYTTIRLDDPMTGMNDSMNMTPTKPRSFKMSLTATATAAAIRPAYSAMPDDSDIEDREETPTPARMIPAAAPNTSAFTPASYSSTSSGLSISPNVHSAITTATTTSSTASSGTRAHKTSDPSKPIRKRRSSLTVGSSPMTAIKSSARHAEAAAQLQRHLARGSGSSMDEILGTSVGSISIVTGAGSGRPRSGSLGGMLSVMKIAGDDVDRFGSPSGGFIHTHTVGNKTMLMRMRSGSVGAKIVAPAPLSFTTVNGATSQKMSGALLRQRRPIRRGITTGIGPSAMPPPNMPLPALPPVPPAPAPISMSRRGSPTRSANSRSGSREATPVPNRL